jgi:Heterokaryon incompatibility protein (HET)
MDHLLLPKDHVPPISDKVPYVCTEKYDGKQFLSYPKRNDKPWLELPGGDLPYMTYAVSENIRLIEQKEQERFLQTWLFFGLLHEMLGDSYCERDFIVQDPNSPESKFLSTVNLLPKLELVWGNLSHSQIGQPQTSAPRRPKGMVEISKEDEKVHYDHIRSCLRLCSIICAEAHPDFDRRIKYCISSVCELVAHAAMRAFNRWDDMQLWASRFYENETKEQMLRAGWCRSDVARAIDKFSSMQTFHLLSRIDKREILRDHQGCTLEKCTSYQIKLDEYHTRHWRPDCNCDDISPDFEAIRDALEAKTLPLLKIVETDGEIVGLDIEVVRSTPETPYIAISHVWADGLGNPKHNSLPKCQLSYIRRRAANISTSHSSLMTNLRAGGSENPPLLIWLDTLCCPIEPAQLKTLALNQMRSTYAGAQEVLVLDASLQCFDFHKIGLVESLARFYTCGWMNRLWTLQEGILARRLWVQFKDGSFDLDQLMLKLSVANEKDVRIQPFLFDLLKETRSLRPSIFYSKMSLSKQAQSRSEEEKTNIGRKLVQLEVALAYRSVSVPADEALCIGTLLDLPAVDDSKASGNASARMGRIWQLIAKTYGGIPQQILTFVRPGLEEEGLRWAPRTILGQGKRLSGQPSNDLASRDSKLGYLRPEGLVVEFPGIELGFKESGDKMIRNPWTALGQFPDSRMFFRGEDEVRLQVCAIRSTSQDGETPEQRNQSKLFLRNTVRRARCALILLNDQTAGEYPQRCWDGLIVQITKCEGDIIFVENKSRVAVSDLDLDSKLIIDTAEQLARELRLDPLTTKVAKLINKKESEEYKAATQAMELKIRAVAEEAMKDKALVDAHMNFYGMSGMTSFFWRFVADWYCHDFVGTRTSEIQKWCVD